MVGSRTRQPLFLCLREFEMLDLLELLAIPLEIFEDAIDSSLNRLFRRLREAWNGTTKKIA